MSFQTTDPSAHGYLYNNCLVIHNKKAVEDAEVHSHISTNYSYNVPNDDHKTIIIDKNVFSVREYYNIFSIIPIVYNMPEHSELTISSITSVITKMISSKTSLKWLLNTINFKIFLFFPDNKKMPFGFVKDAYHEKDIFDLAFPEKLPVYIKTFQFDNNGDVKLLPTEDNSVFTRSLYESIIYGKAPITSTTSTTSTVLSQPLTSTVTTNPFGGISQNVQNSPAPFAASAAAGNSFGASSTAGNNPNPFGATSSAGNPFGATSAVGNSFGASSAAGNNPNPFGATSAACNNPNPFGSSAVGNNPNPFGATTSNSNLYGQPNLFNKTATTQKLYTYGQ